MNWDESPKATKAITRSRPRVKQPRAKVSPSLFPNRRLPIETSSVLRDLESQAQVFHTIYEQFPATLYGGNPARVVPDHRARVISAAAPPIVRSSPKAFLVFRNRHCSRTDFEFCGRNAAGSGRPGISHHPAGRTALCKRAVLRFTRLEKHPRLLRALR